MEEHIHKKQILSKGNDYVWGTMTPLYNEGKCARLGAAKVKFPSISQDWVLTLCVDICCMFKRWISLLIFVSFPSKVTRVKKFIKILPWSSPWGTDSLEANLGGTDWRHLRSWGTENSIVQRTPLGYGRFSTYIPGTHRISCCVWFPVFQCQFANNRKTYFIFPTTR